jgi:hypothetical protein
VALIGSQIELTCGAIVLLLPTEQLIEQGVTVELQYDSNISVTQSGRLFHRAVYSKPWATFTVDAIVDLVIAKDLYQEFDFYKRQKKARQVVADWILNNQRIKLPDVTGLLTFQTYSVTPIELTYEILSNSQAKINLQLQELLT